MRLRFWRRRSTYTEFAPVAAPERPRVAASSERPTYRPIEIEVRMTPQEAELLLRKLLTDERLDMLRFALQDAIERTERWGSYPPPFRALLIGLDDKPSSLGPDEPSSMGPVQ